jgi:hypothetical protein
VCVAGAIHLAHAAGAEQRTDLTARSADRSARPPKRRCSASVRPRPRRAIRATGPLCLHSRRATRPRGAALVSGAGLAHKRASSCRVEVHCGLVDLRDRPPAISRGGLLSNSRGSQMLATRRRRRTRPPHVTAWLTSGRLEASQFAGPRRFSASSQFTTTTSPAANGVGRRRFYIDAKETEWYMGGLAASLIEARRTS